MKFFKQICYFSCIIFYSAHAMQEECTDKIEKNEENLALLAQQALQIKYSLSSKTYYNIIDSNQEELNDRINTKYRLDCDYKQITSFDTYLKKLVELYNDHILIHPINVAPLETFCLKRLYLKYNKISTLPASFTSLNTLEVLRLEGNEFKKFPPEICALVSLTHLWLNNNKIEGTLPIAQGDLPNLQLLDLENNQKITFPKACAKLTNLQKLMYDKSKATIEYPNHPLFPKEMEKIEKKEGILSRFFSKK